MAPVRPQCRTASDFRNCPEREQFVMRCSTQDAVRAPAACRSSASGWALWAGVRMGSGPCAAQIDSAVGAGTHCRRPAPWGDRDEAVDVVAPPDRLRRRDGGGLPAAIWCRHAAVFRCVTGTRERRGMWASSHGCGVAAVARASRDGPWALRARCFLTSVSRVNDGLPCRYRARCHESFLTLESDP